MNDRRFATQVELEKLIKLHRSGSRFPVELTDSTARGLMIRVRPTTTSAWYIYKSAGEKHRIELGEYPADTLKELREKRNREAGRRADKTQPDPHELVEQQKCEAEEAKAKAESEGLREAWTVSRLAREYFKHCRAYKRPASADAIERHFGGSIEPAIGKMPVIDVSAEIIRSKVLTPILEGEAENVRKNEMGQASKRWSRVRMRNAVRVTMSTFFEWVARPETRKGQPANNIAPHLHDLANPIRTIAVMQAPKASNGKAAREDKRAMTRTEAQELWKLLKIDRGNDWADILALQLLCGTRIGETALVEWLHINMGHRVWTIPAHLAKNGKEHVITLSDAAVELLKARKGRRDGRVFTARADTTNKQFKKYLGCIDLSHPIAEYSTHSVRKTVATGIIGLGYRQEVRAYALNQSVGDALQQAYDHSDWAEPAQQALADWAKCLDTGDLPDNVVELGRSA